MRTSTMLSKPEKTTASTTAATNVPNLEFQELVIRNDYVLNGLVSIVKDYCVKHCFES